MQPKQGRQISPAALTEVRELRQGGRKGETPRICIALSQQKKKRGKIEWKMPPPVLQTGGRTERAAS